MFNVCLVATSGSNWEQQWSYLLSHFKPKKIYVIGELDPRVHPFRDYISIETAEEIEETLVVLSPDNGFYVKGDTDLITFDHPEDCCYLFGSDSQHLSEDHLGKRKPDFTVFIDTDTNDTMYSFMAGAITLYDRKIKNG